jgi:large subunit ribosomal protein L23
VSASQNRERLMTVIKGPHVSEKTSIAAELHNQVVFKVRTDATKQEIRQAVELLFEVSVDEVQVINCRGKIKRHGSNWGQRAAWKKAYVKLAEGSHIDFVGAE